MSLIIILSIFSLDQITKFIFRGAKSFFIIDHIGIGFYKSYGYMFGIFMFIEYKRWLVLLFFTILIFVVQLFFRFYWIKFRKNLLTNISFNFIIGGILGNFLDCAICGYVRDFILFPIIYSTNMADIFIFIGFILIMIEFFINKEFNKLLFKFRPIKEEMQLMQPIFFIIYNDIKKVLTLKE